jgi:hypothetical protein
MMSFDYKNPTSSTILNGPVSVTRQNDTGTNFSVESIGGYMEVYKASDLIWTIPNDILINGGQVLYSGNTIPISFNYNVPYSLSNQLNINNDLISSGRRRLGMLVYVYETDTVYQYTMSGYTTLWNDAELVGSIVNIGSGYIAMDDTPEGIAFVNAWTATTVEGVDGETRENAKWKIYISPYSNIYTSNGAITSNRSIGLDGFSLSYSSDTQPNLLVLSGDSISIGTATPDVNAILDISSTDKGVLFPRMTTVQRTGMTTTEGMVVYDTDEKKLYLYTTEWEYIQSGGMSGYWNK